jgi:peptidyl-prolyl cis-trans isomerase D
VLVEDKPSAADEADIKKSIDGLLSSRVVYNESTGKERYFAWIQRCCKHN